MPPELTDEWVADNLADVDTVEAWTANIRDNISANKPPRCAATSSARSPRRSPRSPTSSRPTRSSTATCATASTRTVRQFQSQGVNMDQFLAATGQDGAAFVESLRGQSVNAIKIDLALRAVAAAEELTVDDDDLDNEYQRIALQVNQKPNQVRKAYESNDLVRDLEAQIRKGKALDWLLHHVEYVDETGETLPLDLVLGHGHDADGNHLPADESDDDVDHDDDTQTDDDAPAVAADSTDTPTTGESTDTEA